jgi:hypothetical protein
VASVDDVATREAELAAVPVPWARVERSVVVDRDVAGAIHEALRRAGNAVACMASHGRGRSAALVGSVRQSGIPEGESAFTAAWASSLSTSWRNWMRV